MKQYLFICMLLLAAGTSYGQKKLAPEATGGNNTEIAFVIPEKDLFPEGITYDKVSKKFFLGSIHKQKILMIDKKGHVSEFVKSRQDSLGNVLGMTVDAERRMLWVCNNYEGIRTDSTGYSSIHKYNLDNGKLVKRYVLKNNKIQHLFNDIVITPSGDAYFTDSEGGGVYKISAAKDEIEPFIEPRQFAYPNGVGLSPDLKSLICSSSRGIFTINLDTKEITPVESEDAFYIILDGLYVYKNSLIGVQNLFIPASINQFNLSPDLKRIESIGVLVVNHPTFRIPTTGVIVDDYFYFIANSHLRYRKDGEEPDMKKLNDIVILKTKLP